MGRHSQTIGRRLRQAAGPAAAPDQQMIALPDGRKLWATAVPRHEWADLQPGHELLLVRTRNQHRPYPHCVEMATVHGMPPAPHQGKYMVLVWGWRAPGEVDNRPATVLYFRELATILRYALLETGCPDVVSTILPTLN